MSRFSIGITDYFGWVALPAEPEVDAGRFDAALESVCR
jgi:hypothetical protein